jgi:hypothetical protein
MGTLINKETDIIPESVYKRLLIDYKRLGELNIVFSPDLARIYLTLYLQLSNRLRPYHEVIIPRAQMEEWAHCGYYEQRVYGVIASMARALYEKHLEPIGDKEATARNKNVLDGYRKSYPEIADLYIGRTSRPGKAALKMIYKIRGESDFRHNTVLYEEVPGGLGDSMKMLDLSTEQLSISTQEEKAHNTSPQTPQPPKPLVINTIDEFLSALNITNRGTQ